MTALAARLVAAVTDPDSIAPRNGHKETDPEWQARVVAYVIGDSDPAEIDAIREWTSRVVRA